MNGEMIFTWGMGLALTAMLFKLVQCLELLEKEITKLNLDQLKLTGQVELLVIRADSSDKLWSLRNG